MWEKLHFYQIKIIWNKHSAQIFVFIILWNNPLNIPCFFVRNILFLSKHVSEKLSLFLQRFIIFSHLLFFITQELLLKIGKLFIQSQPIRRKGKFIYISKQYFYIQILIFHYIKIPSIIFPFWNTSTLNHFHNWNFLNTLLVYWNHKLHIMCWTP